MARFAQKHTTAFDAAADNYEAGFSYATDSYDYISEPGLTDRTVEVISQMKAEPDWMLQMRKVALRQFQGSKMPAWGADLSSIDFKISLESPKDSKVISVIKKINI